MRKYSWKSSLTDELLDELAEYYIENNLNKFVEFWRFVSMSLTIYKANWESDDPWASPELFK